MAKIEHAEWLRDGFKSWNERRKLISFRPDLSGVDFHDARYGSGGDSDLLDFRRYDFSGANLQEANLSGLDFSKAKFIDADLSRANMTRGIFASARFNGAILRSAAADEAIFIGADLTRANLTGIETTRADFSYAKLNQLVIQKPTKEISEAIRSEERRSDGSISHAELPNISFKLESREQVVKEPTYLVLFATNRQRDHSSGSLAFNGERSQSVHYGSCQVFVPESHTVGSLGSPFWKRLLRGDDRLKIRRLISLDGQLHWRMVSENFGDSAGASPPTVLIHGFNTSFEEAVLWAAQIGFDLGLRRGVSLFSWPSKGSKSAYAADEASADVSKYHLAEYILKYLSETNGKKVNLIAHSMGCRCLIAALEIIGSKNPNSLTGINQIIFAAADVDQGLMPHVVSHLIMNKGRTTSYVCDGDQALRLSSWLHSFARVGFLPPVFMYDNIDTVEVKRPGLLDFGHGYMANAKPILNDIFQLIKHSTQPSERFSITNAGPGSTGHWRLIE